MNTQLYYKFLSLNDAINDVENEWIKISLIAKLNDPFELLPYLRYSNPSERHPYNEFRKNILKEYGLLCFSGNWEEPLLWSHYADKHTGVAIGFEISTLEISKVNYSNQRIKFDLTNDYEKNLNLFFESAKRKYINWGYEDEYRIIKKFDNNDVVQKKREKSKNYDYFLKFDKNITPKKIILGCKFNSKKWQEVVNVSRKHNIEIIHARQNWGEYKISKDGRRTNELSLLLTNKFDRQSN